MVLQRGRGHPGGRRGREACGSAAGQARAGRQQKEAKATSAPPLAGKSNGESNERLDINSMTEDEMMELPPSVLDKLLGNEV